MAPREPAQWRRIPAMLRIATPAALLARIDAAAKYFTRCGDAGSVEQHGFSSIKIRASNREGREDRRRRSRRETAVANIRGKARSKRLFNGSVRDCYEGETLGGQDWDRPEYRLTVFSDLLVPSWMAMRWGLPLSEA